MEKRKVAFIHGFLEQRSMWNPILDRLSKRKLEIILPELPGHGSRANEFIVPDARVYADDIVRQLQLNPGEDVFIIGHSMGGYIASAIAAWHPQIVRGLCLFHSKAGSDPAEKIENRWRAIEAARENQALYVRTMISNLFAESSRESLAALIEEQISYAKSLPLQSIVDSQTTMARRPGQLEAMRSRTFPLYYFLGDQDAAIPLEHVESEIKNLPGAVAHVATGVGHMSHWERPDEAGEFIQRILRADY